MNVTTHLYAASLRKIGKRRSALVRAAWAAVRVKDSYLQSQFRRLRSHRGAKKIILAVAASMLTATYHRPSY